MKIFKSTPNIALIAFVLFAAASAEAQTATHKWSDFVCEYSGTYDTKRYTKAEIEGTGRLYAMSGWSPLGFSATVWNYADIGDLDIAELEREYKDKRAELVNLKLVKGEYWEGVRQRKLKELDEFYRLSSVTARAYREPAVLRSYEGAAACKKQFAEPIIAGGESLIKAWEAVNNASRAVNADPERLKREFEQQKASPDRLKFALVETMSFGWWNCANNERPYHEPDHEAHDREFKKLFTKIKELGCDEP
ncbi:MAG: hypothetical protein H0V76_08140 [Blastocatellia bacterium]|nr:hypothetical protein [Blastocatellia bacterium]